MSGEVLDPVCLRLTRMGRACRNSALDWTWASSSGIPDPRSCRIHMTRPELEALWAGESAWRRHEDAEGEQVFPACWTWPVTQDHHGRDFEAYRHDPSYAAMRLIEDWQAGRCAVCGYGRGRMVADHCHDTGNFRGLLCHSCNTREGKAWDDDPLYARYRFRPPAVILSVSIFWAEANSARAILGPDPAEALARWQERNDPARR